MTSLNRIVMQKTSRAWFAELTPKRLDVLEISGNWGASLGFRSHESVSYPAFDICQGPLRDAGDKVRKFDLVMANQVWEHLDRPYAATRNVWKMLRRGGYFWVAVPFFIPFHAAPNDCSRWTARGLGNLLIECGFEPDEIRAAQWGNRASAARNLETPWPPRFDADTDDLDDDPEFPLVSWAIARRV
ncbi:class I SAM-dependent methyltransferase [Paracoccus pacificus]|uniref:Class I SAM-dependent methyltransferase n=1 Tax=Paracoccus pacificus TaxID=1463598 RepID=A0ABW4RCL2_9RHOB